MVTVRLENKPAFKVYGRKIWVEQDNEMFGRFWQQCREDGLVDRFKMVHPDLAQTVTQSYSIGVSRVERDPAIRSFWFYIATESGQPLDGLDLEAYTVPASLWAIFANNGKSAEALIEAEMYAFGEWLPNSQYVHALAPEIEAYPPGRTEEGQCYEFWLPVTGKV